MLVNDLRRPPEVPDAQWLREFSDTLHARRPQLSDEAATAQALLAHSFTWLLDAAEAAELWECALAERLPQWRS